MRPLTIRLSSKRAIYTVIIVVFLNRSRAKILFFYFFLLSLASAFLFFSTFKRAAPSLFRQVPYFRNFFFHFQATLGNLENSSLLTLKKRLSSRTFRRQAVERRRSSTRRPDFRQ